MERRLAAVMIADVAGYGRLSRFDEEGTRARFQADLHGVFEPKIAAHHGRLIKTMGDGLLVEFHSVVDALRCAVDIQRAEARQNAALPARQRLAFRIGINLGDVIVEGDDIHGDGVNISDRLQTLAEPGGIAISGTAYDQVEAKLDVGYRFVGEQLVKNIDRPVRVYQVLLDPHDAGRMIGGRKAPAAAWRWPVAAAGALALVIAGAAAAWWRPWETRIEPASIERMALPLPDKPSIAVLPFTNMSADPEQEYFADGMTDDLITDLSKVSGLFVIARNSTFAYKGRRVEMRQVAEDLGVRYVVEGSVRRAGDTVRVNAQLVDTITGGQVWADRYDGKVADIFAVQDDIVRTIAGALALNLSDGEQKAIARGETSNIQAREAFQKGWEHQLRFTAEDNAAAAKYFRQAAEIDPEYGRAYAALGIVYVRGCQWRWNNELGITPGAANNAALGYLSQAEKRESSLTAVAASQIELYNDQQEKALTEAARAIALDPNDPEAHVAMALALITTGRPDAGLKFVETALRLNPSHPTYYVLAQGMAHFALHDLERAASVLSETLGRHPDAVELAPLLAATYAQLGRRSDARAVLLQWQPDASQLQLQALTEEYHIPFPWAQDERATQERLVDGLYVAGLPLDVTVASLVDSLRQKDGLERRNVIRDLGRFGRTAADAVPVLIDVLADENPLAQSDAVRSLGKIGPAAADAIPALIAMEGDERNGVLARQALKEIRGF
jgi:TolB-like protein/class 3 adenylate cyclase/Flp pilus assembly protein TadD